LKRGNKQRPILRLKKQKPMPLPATPVPPSVANAKALSAILAAHSEVWRTYLPLRVGAIEEVYTLLRNEGVIYSKRVVHKCLQWHCRNPRYVAGLVVGASRYALDGGINGEVLPIEVSENNRLTKPE